MKRINVEKYSFILIMLMLISLLISSILIIYTPFSLKEYSYVIISFGVLGLILYICSKFKNFKFSKYEIMLYFLVVFACLSLIDSLNIKVAIWGMEHRHEGLLVILSYYILTLLSINIKNKKYVKIIIGTILGIGVINLIYSLMQRGIFEIPFIKLYNNDFIYSSGFNGSHMSFGSLMSICLPIVLGLYFNSKSIRKSILYSILIIGFSVGVIISGTMSIVVGMVFVCLLIILKFIISLIKKDYSCIKNMSLKGAILIIPCIIALIIGLNSNQYLTKDIFNTFKEATSMLKGEVSDDFGTGRIHIWKNTIPKIKENYLNGVGIDNFFYAFRPPLLDVTSGAYVTKVHNDYLQKMLCEGMFSGTLFIGFLLIVFYDCFKKKNNELYYGLFLAFSCYSVQSFFNISVTRVAPIYFIVIGLLISYNNIEEIRKEN